MQHIGVPPCVEVVHYSTSNTVMQSKVFEFCLGKSKYIEQAQLSVTINKASNSVVRILLQIHAVILILSCGKAYPESPLSDDCCMFLEIPGREIAEEHGETLTVNGGLLLRVGRAHWLKGQPSTPVARLSVALLSNIRREVRHTYLPGCV